MQELADEIGRPVGELHLQARRYMKEMIAQPNSFFIDWMAKVTRFIVSRSYGSEIVCNPDDLERTRQILRDYPAALLWTHKSHIDGMALLKVLYENDLPAPHAFGGINMAFAGLGLLGRRSGIIYIRRTFNDNPVYKLVFRHYLGYLMEKRFPFSWAFEGTRSRTGKLMPPRYGLIKYVLQAAHATRASDLHFIPVSISYDLIGDVSDYAREQAGLKKTPESLRWFLGYIAKMRCNPGGGACDPRQRSSFHPRIDQLRPDRGCIGLRQGTGGSEKNTGESALVPGLHRQNAGPEGQNLLRSRRTRRYRGRDAGSGRRGHVQGRIRNCRAGQ